MEKSTRGLVLEFVKKLDQNSELGKLEDSLFDNICDIVNKAKAENNEEIEDLIVSLERKMMSYIELVKYQYFDYGVAASDIEGEVNVNWQPKGMISLIEKCA
ncbi:MAG: hypothetical protein ACLT40_08260 [Fusobacterium sp.]